MLYIQICSFLAGFASSVAAAEALEAGVTAGSAVIAVSKGLNALFVAAAVCLADQLLTIGGGDCTGAFDLLPPVSFDIGNVHVSASQAGHKMLSEDIPGPHNIHDTIIADGFRLSLTNRSQCDTSAPCSLPCTHMNEQCICFWCWT